MASSARLTLALTGRSEQREPGPVAAPCSAIFDLARVQRATVGLPTTEWVLSRADHSLSRLAQKSEMTVGVLEVEHD
jgi:hypothetical protein